MVPNKTLPPIMTGMEWTAGTPRLLTKKLNISAAPTAIPAQMDQRIPGLSYSRICCSCCCFSSLSLLDDKEDDEIDDDGCCC